MDIHERLILRRDALAIPLEGVEPEVRSNLDAEEGDVVLSCPGSRAPSLVIDGGSAAWLERFREPCSLAAAVILFSRETGEEPAAVLEGIFPLLSTLLERGFLTSAEDGRGDAEPHPAFLPGRRLEIAAGVEVVRWLQRMDDTELYQVRRGDGGVAVLKISPPEPARPFTSLEHEAAVLAVLEGTAAPRLLECGEVDGRRFLLLEWCPGVDPETTAAEWRSLPPPESRRRLLELGRGIAEAYADLHRRGVVHGDVHPRNVLVDRNVGVRLVDFGLARRRGEAPAPERGGVPFFFEPEYAQALLEGRPAPAASEAGEQYALGALLYRLLTGSHYLDFRLERRPMLEQIVAAPPRSFRERGRPPWPRVEAALARALAKQPERRFPTVADLAAELAAAAEAVPPTAAASRASPPRRDASLAGVLDRVLAAAALDGPWLAGAADRAPAASVSYGAAGVACALHCLAGARDDAAALALAGVWAARAVRRARGDEVGEAFYNPRLEITPEVVGETSPYHTASGVFAVQAMIARAEGNPSAQARAHEAFLGACRRDTRGPDLSFGHAGTLLACTLLLEGLPEGSLPDPGPLRQLAQESLGHLWSRLGEQGPIPEAQIDNLGMAHGWAGFLYATFEGCRALGVEPPPAAERCLSELAALAEPTGRGLGWPWSLGRGSGPRTTMPGWCNGSAGHVHLWCAAHRRLGDPLYLELAEGAAWDAWEAPERAPTLCCGLVGRAYALLRFYQATGEEAWRRRAAELARRAAVSEGFLEGYPHSLYKGELALAVLAADLERPDAAAQPFFAPEGWDLEAPAIASPLHEPAEADPNPLRPLGHPPGLLEDGGDRPPRRAGVSLPRRRPVAGGL
jgi:serine/threonine-protein kinase